MPKEGCKAADQPFRISFIEHSEREWLCTGKLTRLCVQPDLKLIVEEVLSINHDNEHVG
jgi:hypothetical protein